MRDPNPLPSKEDINAMAGYYKQVYNTPEGKATPEEAIKKYNKYIGSEGLLNGPSI